MNPTRRLSVPRTQLLLVGATTLLLAMLALNPRPAEAAHTFTGVWAITAIVEGPDPDLIGLVVPGEATIIQAGTQLSGDSSFGPLTGTVGSGGTVGLVVPGITWSGSWSGDSASGSWSGLGFYGSWSGTRTQNAGVTLTVHGMGPFPVGVEDAAAATVRVELQDLPVPEEELSITATPSAGIEISPEQAVTDSGGEVQIGMTSSAVGDFTLEACTPDECATAEITFAPVVAHIEFTQAIQELQSPTDLQANGPAVPIVKGKPAVMRLMFSEVSNETGFVVEVSGSVSETKFFALHANCDPLKQRRREGGCETADFYFTPGDNVNVTVTVREMDGTALGPGQTVNFDTTTASPIILAPVRICHSLDALSGRLVCPDRGALAGIVPLLSWITPTHSVQLLDSSGSLAFVPLPNPFEEQWWGRVLLVLSRMGSEADTHPYGMVRPEVPSIWGGMAAEGVGTAAGKVGVPFAAEIVAHETFHLLGRQHTGITGPACWGAGTNPDPYWQTVGTNGIQEVGFNTQLRVPILPESTFDVMSYCAPVWISPHTYKGALVRLSSGGVGAASLTQAPVEVQTFTQSDFWSISGVIESTAVTLEPVFEVSTKASTDPGSGTYRIDVEDGTSSILFTRFFEPTHAEAGDFESDIFNELVPANSAATKIVIRDPLNNALGTINLGGAAPSTEIIYPTGGESLTGEQELSWSVLDPDSTAHTFLVEYSTDGGITWNALVSNLTEPSVVINFDDVAGSASAKVRVLASDGVNTGVGLSELFTVPSKSPTAEILTPADGSVYDVADLVWLQGVGWDPDDGYLAGAAMQWESSRDGLLGTGAELHATDLSPGTHAVTLTVTDGEGNEATDSIVIAVKVADEDGDGCGDLAEVAPNSAPSAGGGRNPLLFWDFFDPNRDAAVSGLDFFAVLSRFNSTAPGYPAPPTPDDALAEALAPPPAPPAYHAGHDRTPPGMGADPWDTGPPDGAISGLDFFLVLAQYNHSCQAPP